VRTTGEGDRNCSATEAALWLAVVQQAFTDSIEGFLGSREVSTARRDCAVAREWLLGNGEDFRIVCALAGLEPDYIRAEARRRRDRGWPASDHNNGRGAYAIAMRNQR